jgi:DNA polymerase-3 subunit gamma/tau
MKSSSNPRVLAEVTLMKIAQPMFEESNEALIKRIENLENSIKNGTVKVVNSPNEENAITVDKVQKEEIVYEKAKSEDVKLVESAWKNVLQRIKSDKKISIHALLIAVDSFNVNSDILYIIFDDKFNFAKPKLNSPDTIEYLETVIRETMNRSFSIKIALKSEIKDVKMEIEEKVIDEGENILKNMISEDILEIKGSIEENQVK